MGSFNDHRSPPDESNLPTWAWVLIAIAVIIIVVMAGVIFVTPGRGFNPVGPK